MPAFASPAAAAPRRILRTSLTAALLSTGLLLLAACGRNLYKLPEYTFANRPKPPSRLTNRVLASYSNGGTGTLQILDAYRDLRNNVMNANSRFPVNGYTGTFPQTIFNFPEQVTGFVFSNAGTASTLTAINYGTESATGPAGLPPAATSSIALTPDFGRILSAEEANGQLILVDKLPSTANTYALNLPGVYRVAANQGDSVLLAMVRNSNTLYRIVQLPRGSLSPPGAVDCQPTLVPVFCVVPVSGTFDRPVDVSFSLDGASAFVLNCGQECGGATQGGLVSVIPQGALELNRVPTLAPEPTPVTATVPIPGGVTVARSDATNLYLAGQQLQPDGLFAGRLTVLNLTTLTPGAPVPISDGYHTRLLLADDNTLWIGSQFCASGERQKLGENTNCLTRYDLGAGTATTVPALAAASSTGPGGVPFPNQDGNTLYYGSLTGLCWVQGLHKVYTAYGGQIHAFRTADGSEIDNTQITLQGTVLDVAYMDAVTNSDN